MIQVDRLLANLHHEGTEIPVKSRPNKEHYSDDSVNINVLVQNDKNYINDTCISTSDSVMSKKITLNIDGVSVNKKLSEIDRFSDDNVEVCKDRFPDHDNSTDTFSDIKNVIIPKHLEDLYERTTKHVNERQRNKTAKLLQDFKKSLQKMTWI